MAVTYTFTIAGVEKTMQPGWSIRSTANSRHIFSAEVVSLDASYRPALDAEVIVLEKVPVTSSSVANPSVITTPEPHGIVTGQKVTIAGHAGSTPSINADHLATRTSATTFTIPVNVTVGGTGGTVGRRIFAGPIETPAEQGLGGYGVTPITTAISAVDYNQIAERRSINQVLLAGTLKSQLTTLVGLLAGESYALHPSQVNGPNVPDFPCDYLKLQDVLESLSIQTGYVWEFDAWKQLRMFLPNSEAAPINLAAGDGNALDDVTVQPSRAEYGNRILLRYSSAALSAYGFLYAPANFGDGNTVQLGAQTYTFDAILSAVEGHVKIGASASASLDNLVDAIVKDPAGAGVTYAADTAVNASATAYKFSASRIKAIALTPGAAGNSITALETGDASWLGEGDLAISTLALGADQELTNVSIAEDPGEQAAHGTWEIPIKAPEVTSASQAATLASAYLSIHLVVPKQVKYVTEKLGLRPGQTQTVVLPTRNLNGTFTITDVVTRNTKGNRVVRTVTAIESLLVQAVPHWHDTYREWSSGAGSAQTVSGSLTVNISGRAIYGFGGSDIEWIRDATPTWKSANSIQVRIDPTVRGSTTGTCYVRLRSRSGSVTARMRNVTDSTTAGTSSVVTSTSFVTVSFTVTLAASPKTYEIQLLPSLANVDVQLGSAYFE